MPGFKHFISTWLLFTAMEACAQLVAPTPVGYIEAPVPAQGSVEWYELNSILHCCQVQLINGQVLAGNIEGKEQTCSLKIHNGTLVGVDRGEWPGFLRFIPSDSSLDPVEIMDGHIRFLFMFEDRICFLEGSPGLFSYGALYELDTFGGQFRYHRKIDLRDAPMAYVIYQDKLMIATYDKFYVVRSGSVEFVIEDVFWGGLYPNSIAAWDHNNIFIGFRGGFARLDPETGKLSFFKRAR